MLGTLQLVALEAYRDLVKLLRRGLDDAQGIRAAAQENIELRAQAKSAAAAAASVPASNSRPAPSIPTGVLAQRALAVLLGKPCQNCTSLSHSEARPSPGLQAWRRPAKSYAKLELQPCHGPWCLVPACLGSGLHILALKSEHKDQGNCRDWCIWSSRVCVRYASSCRGSFRQ